jgi:hypothetical protein
MPLLEVQAMKDLTWKEALETGGVSLFVLIVLQTCRPEWMPGWAPFAGAAFVLVMLMSGIAAKQKAAADKEAREESERQERQAAVELEKHKMTLDRQEAREERRREAKRARRTRAITREEANGRAAVDS